MSGKIHLQRKFERAEFSPWASHHSGMGHKSPLADPFKKGFSKSLIQNSDTKLASNIVSDKCLQHNKTFNEFHKFVISLSPLQHGPCRW